MKTWHILTLIVLMAIGIRVGILLHTRYNAPHCGTATQLATAGMNIVEGRGYVVDWDYVDRVSNEQLNRSKQLDLQDYPPMATENNYEPYFLLPPGTSALQALTYKIFGQYRYIYSRVLQLLIDSFGCVFAFMTANLIWGRKQGFIGAILYALWLPIVYMSTWALHDALMPLFMMVILYLFVRGVYGKKKNIVQS